MSNMIKALAAIGFAVFAQSASAVAITHGTGGTYTWNNGTSVVGPSDFDRAQFMFAAEYADTITLANFGSGYAHVHNGSERAQLEVFDGTSWINVFETSPGGHMSLATMFANPVTFTGMTISGLRLDSNVPAGNLFHGVSSSMTYVTSGTPVNEVPEPASLALVGLGLLGFAAARRKSK